MQHHVKLNIGAIGSGDRPDPDAPVMTIDGNPIEGIVSISMTAAVDELTQVTLTFWASVEATLIVDDQHLIYPEPQFVGTASWPPDVKVPLREIIPPCVK